MATQPAVKNVYGADYDIKGNLLPSAYAKYGLDPSGRPIAPAKTTPTTSAPQLDYGAAYKAAASMFGADASSVDAYSTAAQNIASAAQTKAADIKAEIPVTQGIYSDVIGLLKQSQDTETQQKTQEKTSALGTQAEQAAESGFNPNTGFEAALATHTAKLYDDQITNIATKYNLQYDQVAQEESKAIGDLVAQADDAVLQGDTQTASMLKDIISLKQNQQGLIQSAAQTLISGGLEQEKIDISKYQPVPVYNPQTGTTTIIPFNVQTGQPANSIAVQGTTSKAASAQYPQPSPTDQNAIAAYATDVKNGTITFAQVPKSIQTQVSQILSQTQ